METLRVDVNLPDKDGCTPLTMACIKGNISVSMYLLTEVKNLDVNITTRRFRSSTALHYAVWCSKELNTQLHTAFKEGDTAEVWKLVRLCSCTINTHNNGFFTPSHFGCYYGHSEIVKTLNYVGRSR